MKGDKAEAEKDPARKAVLMRTAEAEDRRALRWEKKLADLGAAPPQTDRQAGQPLQPLVN